MYKSLKQFEKDMTKNLKKYSTFVRGLTRRKVNGLASKVNRLHKDAYKKIDCGQCANCCKTMTPTYTKADVKRIAAHVGMTEKEYWKKYLEVDENKDIVNRKTPCHFLDKDNRCTIYAVRPADCRTFPHTQRTDFVWQRDIHIQNLDYCPITYHIVEKLHDMVMEKKNTI